MFIKLTRFNGSHVIVNTNQILSISEGRDRYTRISLIRDSDFDVIESIEEIEKMLPFFPVIIDSNTGKIENLYVDDSKGICHSNDLYDKLSNEDYEEIDKLREKLFKTIGVPLEYLLSEEDKEKSK